MARDSRMSNADRIVYRRKPRKKQALLGKKRLLFLAAVLGLLLIYLGLYRLFHIPYFQMNDVHILGVETLPESDIKLELLKLMSGDRWFLIPRSNVLFISPRSAEDDLLKQFPGIQEVHVQKIFPHTLSVTLNERKLWAIYCILENSQESNASSTVSGMVSGQCVLMDHTGVPFQKAPHVEGNLILTFQSNAGDVTLGDPIFSQSEINQFDAILGSFDGIGINVTGFQLKQNAPSDVWVAINDGYNIIMTRNDDASHVASIVKTVLDKEVGAKKPRLRYLDARFGNKVFIKYR